MEQDIITLNEIKTLDPVMKYNPNEIFMLQDGRIGVYETIVNSRSSTLTITTTVIFQSSMTQITVLFLPRKVLSCLTVTLSPMMKVQAEFAYIKYPKTTMKKSSQ